MSCRAYTGVAAGEAAFIYIATLIGLKLAKPLGDKESYEFIVDNGWFCFKIQIKTTSILASRTSHHVTAGRGADQKTPYRKGEIDFFVIYVIPEDTWYTMPWEALPGRVGLNIPSRLRGNLGAYEQYCNRWDLLLDAGGSEALINVQIDLRAEACLSEGLIR